MNYKTTDKLIEILWENWQQTLQPFNVDSEIANNIFFEIVSCYSHPSRYYHNLTHIHVVLNKIEFLQTYIQDLPSVKLAAWFHDIVYDTHAQNNEENSAEYAVATLKKLAIPNHTIHKIKNLILATKNHQSSNIESQVLLDADLAIFAADSIYYQEYAQGIRQEYSWVNEADYIRGRQQVLKSFLQRPYIYFTPLMLDSCEELARFNIITELNNFIEKNTQKIEI
jgi:predicted metal-dependent HD superfamily phosphohydrolase